jgi:hypothetical protein
MNREIFVTLNKTRLFTAYQVVDIVQSERDKVLKLVADAIENQKDHKEFLLTRDQKDIVLDIIDGIRAELRQQAGEP